MPVAAKPRAVASADAQPAIVQDYDPQPAMWVLKDDDTTIYMLGTIHILPPGFRWRNPQLDTIIDEVDELVLESTDTQGQRSMARLAPKMRSIMEAREPTSEQLSPAVREKWRRLVELSGMPFEITDSMPLMAALLGFGFAGVNDSGSSYEYGVETVLEEEFRNSDRPISGIEDFGYVMLSLYRSKDQLVIHDLEAMLAGWSGKVIDPVYGDAEQTGEELLEMEHAWARGEVGEEMDMGFGGGKLNRKFGELLLTNRNRAWAEWLEKRLEQPGEILLAVGAGHFEGRNSVLQTLKARGLEARRIN